MPVAINAKLGSLLDVNKQIQSIPGGCALDARGNNLLDAFKKACKIGNLQFFLDVQENDTNSILFVNRDDVLFDASRIATNTEIRNVTGWARLTTRDERVIISRPTGMGSCIDFIDELNKKHDTVYRLLSKDLDTDADRGLVAVELYISLVVGAAGNTVADRVYFSATDDPEHANCPYLDINFTSGTYTFNIVGNSGTATSTVISDVPADSVIAFRIVFDHDNAKMYLYYRASINVSGYKLADDWTAVADDDIVYSEDYPRSICFHDYSVAVGGSINHLLLHNLLLQNQSTFVDVTTALALTPGANITIARDDSQVRSITIIGDADITATSPVDTEGREVVIVNTSMKTNAELNKFIAEYVANYTSDKTSIKIEDFIDNENVYHPGFYYTFIIDVTEYTMLLRSATAKWSNGDNACRWTLNFGDGKFDREFTFRASSRNDADIKSLMLK